MSMTYYLDTRRDVLIRVAPDHRRSVLEKSAGTWRPFDPQRDDSYARALIFGEGCWEDLDLLEEAEALEILRQWQNTAE